jgi:hypothetical protein
MRYDYLVRDFARRTQRNLEYVRSAQHGGADVYEVTQLINSMLGLLVFPQQQYVDAIPATPVSDLERDGWPIPRIVGDYPQVNDLNQLVKYLRNAIAHCNLEFISDSSMDIQGVQVWNVPPNGQTNWKAQLTIAELHDLTEKFLTLLLGESGTLASA